MILRCLLIVASPYTPYTSSVLYMNIHMCTPTPFQCARLLDFNVYAYSNTGVGVHINIYILIYIVHIWYTGGTGGISMCTPTPTRPQQYRIPPLCTTCELNKFVYVYSLWTLCVCMSTLYFLYNLYINHICMYTYELWTIQTHVCEVHKRV